MVHFTKGTLGVLQRISQKEKEFEENILKRFDNITERDMAKQRIIIKEKLEQKKPLDEFERWFVKQPEFYGG
jgi:hypothetical protein